MQPLAHGQTLMLEQSSTSYLCSAWSDAKHVRGPGRFGQGMTQPCPNLPGPASRGRTTPMPSWTRCLAVKCRQWITSPNLP